jgi:hypothetical protein
MGLPGEDSRFDAEGVPADLTFDCDGTGQSLPASGRRDRYF